jgi:hypothetical protein
MDSAGRFGHKPIIGAWRNHNASRYVRMFQARRSLLVWKVFGQRSDGWSNDDFPTERTPGNAATLQLAGRAIPNTLANRNRADLDFTGSIMPPADAVKSGKVKPLSDEDRLTLVRWIDLGCPIDLDYDEKNPENRGFGWMLDDQRPTLTLTYPAAGSNTELTRILVGMHDYGTGIDATSFTVTADFPVDGVKPGENLAARFKETSAGVRELKLGTPMKKLERGTLTVGVKDRQGNLTRIERTIWVGVTK